MKSVVPLALACALFPSALVAQRSSGSTAAPNAAVPYVPSPVPAAGRPNGAVSNYRISAGDQLEIYVWGDERLQRPIGVLPDGTFAFPLAGTVMAAGHTPNEVEDELSRLLAPQYKGVPPQVTVSVRQPSGMLVSVVGKVRSPGTFSPIRYVTLLDIIALAGGPSDFADLGNIVILRHTTTGKSSVVHAKLSSVFKGKPSDNDLTGSGNPLLMAGDTVVIP